MNFRLAALLTSGSSCKFHPTPRGPLQLIIAMTSCLTAAMTAQTAGEEGHRSRKSRSISSPVSLRTGTMGSSRSPLVHCPVLFYTNTDHKVPSIHVRLTQAVHSRNPCRDKPVPSLELLMHPRTAASGPHCALCTHTKPNLLQRFLGDVAVLVLESPSRRQKHAFTDQPGNLSAR